jgi:hypothetical protein
MTSLMRYWLINLSCLLAIEKTTACYVTGMRFDANIAFPQMRGTGGCYTI